MFLDDIKKKTKDKVKRKENEEMNRNKLSDIINSINIEIENEADFGNSQFKTHIPRSLRQEIRKYFTDEGFTTNIVDVTSEQSILTISW